MNDSPDEPTPEAAAEPPPPADAWRVPLHCFHCGGSWDVPRRAFRTGGVLHCTGCHAPFVVLMTMFRELVDRIAALEARGVAADSDVAQRELDELSRTFRPPGMPRKSAGIFG